MKSTKRIFCIALAALFLFGSGTVAVFANEFLLEEVVLLEEELLLSQGFAPVAGKDVSQYPVIFMAGSWHHLFVNEHGPEARQTVFNPQASLGADAEGMQGVMDAVLSLNMDAFADALINLYERAYGAIAMNPDGTCPLGNVSADMPLSRMLGNNPVKDAMFLDAHEMYFGYDWRADPWDNAQRLHDFIEGLIATHGEEYGFDKVNVQTVSGSGPIMMCYLDRWGTKNLASLVINQTMHNGTSLFGGMAAGRFGLDAGSLGIGGLTMGGLQAAQMDASMLLRVLYEIGLLDVATRIFNFFARGAYERFFEEGLKPLLFHMPNQLAMIPTELYGEAKALLFGDDPQYAPLIARADRFHEIRSRQDEIIMRAASEIKVSVRAGYGAPLSPLTRGTNVQSDQLVDTRYASLGAITATPGMPFNSRYVQAEAGARDYISPDRYIDASTALLRDYTWFAKDQPHGGIWKYDGWYQWWLSAEGDHSVWANAKFPQYTQCIMPPEGSVYFGHVGFSTFIPLEAEEPGMIDDIMLSGLQFLSIMRWLLLLPLFWM